MNSALRVLVVDDEPIVRDMLAEVLGDAGINVIGQASDGIEGVALARTSQPDAILLDIRMPNLDGLAAGRQIRETDPYVRIVFFSAYDDPALKQEAQAVGASTLLVKGCPLGEIVDALNGRDSASTAFAIA
jgi:DNA-binding NarL/FixJ family response regulator